MLCCLLLHCTIFSFYFDLLDIVWSFFFFQMDFQKAAEATVYLTQILHCWTAAVETFFRNPIQKADLEQTCSIFHEK